MILNCPNIEFRTFDDIMSEVSEPRKLNHTTVIMLIGAELEDKIIDRYADIFLKAGGRSFVFYGNEAEKWHYMFDVKSVGLIMDSDDVALTSTLDTLEELPDELLISEESVLIYASDYKLVRKSYEIIINAGYGN